MKEIFFQGRRVKRSRRAKVKLRETYVADAESDAALVRVMGGVTTGVCGELVSL
jgi:hypothetical protein